MLIDKTYTKDFGASQLLKAYRVFVRVQAKALEELAHNLPVDAPWAQRNNLLETAHRAWRMTTR